MALKGDLASVDLAQVFQMLSLNQKVGVLGIEAARATRALHFDSRGVTILFDRLALEERLIMQAQRRGMVADDVIQDAIAHSERNGQSVLDALGAGGYLGQDDLASMTRIELEEDIYDIFFWRNAQFEFYEGAESLATCADHRDERCYFSVDTVIMEAARRIDEWAFINQRVKTATDVFRARDVDPSPLSDSDALIFAQNDGMRNVGRLIELTGLPRFQVFKSLAVLHERNYIEEVPEEDLWGYARRCVEADRPEDAIELFEKAIESGVDCSGIRAEAARVYEQIEEFARSAAHLKRVAAAHVEAGETASAVGHLLHAVQMLPTDLEAREQLVELTVGLPEAERNGFDPSAHGKQLVDIYLEIGEIDRVRRILEQLLRVAPHDLALKKRLINVHTKAGDTRRVVELYESIADDLVRDREPIEAIKYLQKIVMIDRSRRDVSERIRGLYEADERRRSRRRSLLALGGLLLVLAGLTAGWYAYERYARSKMLIVEGAVHQLLDTEEFERAIARLDEFIAQYPLTIVAKDAGVEKARIESLRDAAQARVRVREQQLEAERQGVRRRYRAAWTEYEDHMRAGRLDEALASIKRVQLLVAEAAGAPDTQWAKSVSLERSRQGLELLISDAAKLDRDAWTKYEAGDWRGARGDWLRVLDDFDVSATARTVKLPVELRSRPIGAAVFVNGKAMTRTVDGLEEPVVTPVVVMCEPGRAATFQYRLDGFAPLDVKVDALTVESIAPTLKVVPKRTYTFSESVRAPVAVEGGVLVVGLRNGRIAIVRIGDGKIEADRALDGLDDVRGRCAIAIGQCFYVTTGGFVESRRVPNGELLWRERLTADPVHDPVLHAGLVIIADRQGRMTGFDPATGRQRCRVDLGGVASGEPAFINGLAYFGTRDREIVAVDLSERKIAARSPSIESGVATPIRTGPGTLGGFIYGDDRGGLVLRRRVTGGGVWRVDLGRSIGADDFVLGGDSIYARSGADSIVQLRVADGSELGRIDFEESILAGPFVSRRHVFVVVRLQRGRDRSQVDLVKAFDRRTLELDWEFEDGGRFVASPYCDAHSLYLPDSKGNVLVFR